MKLKAQLLNRLDYVDATREARTAMAVELLACPQWVPALLDIGFGAEDPAGHRACWVLERAIGESPEILFPHLEAFTLGLEHLQGESSIRPMAKLCEILSAAYTRNPEASRPPLSRAQRERMVAACFDWLIGPHKVAPKAFAMQTLLALGQEWPWVHRELRATLEKRYPTGSAGYQARARKVLKLLDKPA